MVNLYSNSNCHRMDLNDMVAQQECGAGVMTNNSTIRNIWALAVNSTFNITYYPNIQSNTTYNCL